ncbi:saccharopine dehydrogenase NADP-binding domain-containing protein [Actinoalloteichus caeruleus]|uniref:Saccharopine dehydrogenase, NADP-dependent n=1 Tax=Actinoalloteichus caeruleus DSM 43889 TaxID=1120930 RepID=A0ABT1JN72_ACTCY|nr:saccharopine dehydrogenase NADP-binding domain-containing protein [Actinoalloteichus caeruleus]MCP2333980.1 Saccharopine dehydrogenase, NADP-dependent [Actinoalloteichus caeruleus DSM 43889]
MTTRDVPPREVDPGGSCLVLGGAGAVGRHLAPMLGQVVPGVVVVASRCRHRAAAVAATVQGGSTAVQLDPHDPTALSEALRDVGTVVNCVEDPEGWVAGRCAERGVRYVDISANAEVLGAVEARRADFLRSGTTAVLSVGVAPGLTNLLATHAVSRLAEAPARVEIGVLLGTGEAHGAAGARWTAEGLAAAPRGRGAGGNPRLTRFPEFGARRAYPFPFSDQEHLRATLGVPVTTRLCFDNPAVTAAVFRARRAVRPLVARLGAGERVAATAGRVRLGGSRFAVVAEAVGAGGGSARFGVTGDGQSRATALVAARVVELMTSGAHPPGVFHLDQFVEPARFLSSLTDAGLRWHERRNVGSG